MNVPTFNSSTEEIMYWKSLALEYKASLKESQDELEEFQTSSRELEAELEAQLEQLDTRCSDLRQQVNILAIENQSLKERKEQDSNEFYTQLNNLQDELSGIKINKESLIKYIRELEQTNDDLERAKRTTVASLEDFEGKLNQAIERNVFLESELDEKESLKEIVQRLKDEARDLRQEVKVTTRVGEQLPDNDTAMKNEQMVVDKVPLNFTNIDSNRMTTDIQMNTAIKKSACQNMNNINGNVSLPPSARVSALNIVGDLLRKVGALESRVASCRTQVKENRRPISLSTSGNHSAR